MAKLYIERSYKRLNNGKNDSRYTPSYFMDEDYWESLSVMFPDYTEHGKKSQYDISIDDMVGWLAVITYDENLMTPKDVKVELKAFKDYFKAKDITIEEMRAKLDEKGVEKINDTTYKVSDEATENWVTYPAQYLYL